MALLTLVTQVDPESRFSVNFPVQIVGLKNISNCCEYSVGLYGEKDSHRNQSVFASNQQLLLLILFFYL